MKAILGNIGIIFGLGFIYFGILIFVQTTSTNEAYKGDTYISKVQAKLDFFENKDASHKYGDEKDLYDEKWSSKQYPVPDSYEAITVTTEADTVVISEVLTAAKETITITH